MEKVLAMVLAGGRGERLSVLVAERTKPAVPFGGKYRIIDFTLSNCVNSSIYKVAVLTQYNPRSLAQHIGIGRPWDMDRTKGGVVMLQPYLGGNGEHWYGGTADAIYQNLYFLEDSHVNEVIILAGDHVYTMRYDHMIDSHRSRQADISVGVIEVPPSEASHFGIVTLDHTDRIIAFEEKPAKAKSNLASMGIYVFNRNALVEILEEAHDRGAHDFGHDILPFVLNDYRVNGYRYRGYWRDVGTVESYWQANMDLVVDLPQLNLYDPDAEVRTVLNNMPPVKLGPRAQAGRSLISHGCIINGTAFNSVLSPGVCVEEGAQVVDSVVLDYTTIGKGVIVQRSIIDKQCWIGPGCHVGYGDDYSPNKDEPDHLNSGITVVGKGAKLPPELKVGRNCRIGCWVEKSDFDGDFLPSGSSVERKTQKKYRV